MPVVEEAPKQRLARIASLPWQDAGAKKSLLAGTSSAISDIWRHRELLGLLVKRELKARYKDSTLGFFWTLIKPLVQLFIYWLVLGKFIGAARNIDNFAIFIFAGLTVYMLFSEIVGGATSSIITNAGLVKKIYLPREIFPLSYVGSALFNFMIQLVILIFAALIAGTLSFGPHLLYALASIVVIVIYSTAVGVLLGALNVYLRDIQYLVEVVLMLFMWGTPILYNWTFATSHMPGWLADIYVDNPISLAVIAIQQAFWAPGSNGPDLPFLDLRLVIAAIVGVAFLWIAQRVFARLQGNFAQEL